jgi:mRNA interferase MazF
VSSPARGDVWWGEAPDAKGRPYLVLTRDEAIPVLRTVLVAPVTRTIRGIPTEVPLGSAEGLPTDCVAAMDAVLSFPKAMLHRHMGSIGPRRIGELCDALRSATDC